ncbi:hypothetical protein D9613_003565 [Agrocybe pediades]|uniref:Nephrocystin 3-like N-terminal domain-containing protein n=1 Tax=Agrocybe pediades TaxID=84607 RepID=A0A8H4QJS3_9AGAR|nr:hypothetical protein D9613_003565 [Agrocybe pediades]
MGPSRLSSVGSVDVHEKENEEGEANGEMVVGPEEDGEDVQMDTPLVANAAQAVSCCTICPGGGAAVERPDQVFPPVLEPTLATPSKSAPTRTLSELQPQSADQPPQPVQHPIPIPTLAPAPTKVKLSLKTSRMLVGCRALSAGSASDSAAQEQEERHRRVEVWSKICYRLMRLRVVMWLGEKEKEAAAEKGSEKDANGRMEVDVKQAQEGSKKMADGQQDQQRLLLKVPSSTSFSLRASTPLMDVQNLEDGKPVIQRGNSGAPLSSTLMNVSHSIVSGGTFIQNNYPRRGERLGYARLLENVATAALHDSVHVVDPPKCYPNTRVAIIQNIIDWSVGTDEELSGKPILWLKGGAGAGKSAIARSVAERCSDEGLLLGTFFFGAADSTRNHVEKLVATISYQISIVLPEFRDTVATFIEDDPLIFNRSIRTQFSTLIVRPLSAVLANRPAASTATPRLIIIDGLDECSSINSQRDLLFTLQEVTNTTSHIRFLVCSRPESHLNSAFSLPQMIPILRNIFLDDDYSAREDIRVYLLDKFEQIKKGHVFKRILPHTWPTPGMVDTLVERSSGQFIYAATVIRYLESPRHRPDHQLNAIFNLRPPFKDLPFTEIDALYRLVISKAEDLSTVLDILAFPALYRECYAKDIKVILQLEQGSVEYERPIVHLIIVDVI